MYTADALADIHERTHRSLAKLMVHCGAMAPPEIDRPLEGFGYPTIRLQFHHVIGAERYWLGVIRGRVDAELDDEAYPTVATLSAFREEVAAATRAYLRDATSEELNTSRRMLTWGGREQELAPARIVMRTQTHIYQHQGQVVAMCRLLGSPAAGMDFPIA